MNEAHLKSLHALWFHFYGILEKVKIRRQEKDPWLWGATEREGWIESTDDVDRITPPHTLNLHSVLCQYHPKELKKKKKRKNIPVNFGEKKTQRSIDKGQKKIFKEKNFKYP